MTSDSETVRNLIRDAFEREMPGYSGTNFADNLLSALSEAGLVIVEKEMLDRLLSASKLLYANSLGCVEKHMGYDIRKQGAPGWLNDTGKDIEAARAMFSKGTDI